MKLSYKLSALCIALLSGIAKAQTHVSTDGTMGARQTLTQVTPHRFTVSQDMGTTNGDNLFHSFQFFSIGKGDTVTFTGAADLKNVISRVTGGDISHINGTLKSEVGQANFYFFNPAGIVFGKGASVDVPAAFHVSSSDVLNFKDGSIFTTSTTLSQLAIAPPTDFGFLGKQVGNLEIRHAALDFDKQKAVSLTGDSIILDSGTITNPSGVITVNASERVALSHQSEMNTDSHSAQNAGDISVNAPVINLNASTVHSEASPDSSGNSGAINITGNALNLSHAAAISNTTWGVGDARDINIKVNDILIDGRHTNPDAYTFIASRSRNDNLAHAGNAGTIRITADSLRLLNDTAISSSTYGAGAGGQVVIKATNMVVDGQDNAATIASNSNNEIRADAGKAGNVQIKTSSLKVLNNGEIASTTFGAGDAGQVAVMANDIVIADYKGNADIFTGILSNTENKTRADAGNAGDVQIKTDNLKVLSRGLITSLTLGTGKAGSIQIKADSLSVSDEGRITSSTYGTGDAGQVTVMANDIVIAGYKGTDNGWFTGISSNTNNKTLVDAGNAGSVQIKTNSLKMLNTGEIASNTFGTGDAGQVTVTATDIVIADYKENTYIFTGILSNTENRTRADAGNAGSVQIKTDSLKVLSRGMITSLTLGAGNAGQVTVSANDIVIDTQGSDLFTGISSDTLNQTQTDAGNAGSVQIKTNNLKVLNGGEIASTTFGTGNAGQVAVTANDIVIADYKGSELMTGISGSTENETRSDAGNAGSIQIKTNNLKVLNSGQIASTTFGTGDAGTIDVTADNIIVDDAVIDSASFNKTLLNAGDAGTVTIKANKINLSNNGLISSETNGTGDAGNVEVMALSSITVNNNSSISAQATSTSQGQTGDVTVSAGEAIYLNQQGKITLRNDANNTALNTITPTSLTVSAPSIALNRDSAMTTQATGNVNAAHILVSAPHQLTLNHSSITTQAVNSNGGNIDVHDSNLINLHNSSIKTYTEANGKGGDVTVNANILLMNNAQIDAQANNIANAGKVHSTLKAIIPSQNQLDVEGKPAVGSEPNQTNLNVIKAAKSGWATPQLNLNGSIGSLNRNALVIPDLNKESCSEALTRGSSLVRRGRGGLPPNAKSLIEF